VSPDFTVYVAVVGVGLGVGVGDGVGEGVGLGDGEGDAVAPVGIFRTCPTRIVVELPMLFSCWMLLTLTPNLLAMPDNVSPETTR
jgi:hypothetical protein